MKNILYACMCGVMLMGSSGCCGKITTERDALRKKVDALTAEVNTLTATNANLNAQLGTLRQQIVDLSTANNELRSSAQGKRTRTK